MTAAGGGKTMTADRAAHIATHPDGQLDKVGFLMQR
jgi:hypothetical protein